MSREKLTNNLVKTLTEDELYKVAKVYLKEVDGIENVYLCNGSWDSGIDLSTNSFEVQVQATIEEKNFEKKLFRDISKASANVKDFEISKQVKYFYSYPLSNHNILKYRKKAKDDFGILLEIIEANRISDVSVAYKEISKLIYDLSDLGTLQSESTYFDDFKVQAYYDLMSFGKSTDIKFNIIKSFILNHLFNHPKTDTNTLLKETNNHFDSKIDNTYFLSVLARLSSERKIKILTQEVFLLEDERSRLDLVLQNYAIEEGLLVKDISNALENYGLQPDVVDPVLAQLSELYEGAYELNLSEIILKDSVIYDAKTATQKLKSLLVEKSAEEITDAQVQELTKTLIKIADSSEILPRIAAGQVYSKVSDPDRLQRYVNQNINSKEIFLDTNVILNLLLAHYNSNSSYSNFHYTIACQFHYFLERNEFTLKTIVNYSREIAHIFKDALSLLPFIQLSVFDKLGQPNNIFYRFFQHLKDFGELSEGISTFEDFLKEFGFTSRTRIDDSFKYQMEFLFDSLKIELENPSYDYAKSYDLIKEEQMLNPKSKNQKIKSNFAITSDAIMFERLGDRDSDINPIDPIFCTWDLSLIKVRKPYFEKFPSCTKWYMFTPTRLMDHVSMMNFQIKPGVVSNELLTILDQDNNFQQLTHTLLDSITTIINTENSVGLKYVNKLADMRKKEILEIDQKVEQGLEVSTDTPQIDQVFRKIFEAYILSKDSQAKYLKRLFTKEEYFDEIIEIIIDETKKLNEGHKVNDTLIEKLNLLIDKEHKLSIEAITKRSDDNASR